MSDSGFIPNAYQTPNAYLDEYMYLLTPEEWMVLSYAIRRIFGFGKRQDRISLSQFTSGTIKSGENKDHGTGLSVATVKKCLGSLCHYRLMIKIADNDTKTNEGILWGLQMESSKVDRSALEERKDKKSKKDQKKMEKARSMRQTPPNGIEDPPDSDIEDPSPNGIETQYTGKDSGKTEDNDEPAPQPIEEDPPEVKERVKVLSNLYSENVGALTPLIAEKIRDAVTTYPTVAWYKPAFEIAVSNNARSWNYVVTVLEGWNTHYFGWKPEFGKKNGNGYRRGKPKADTPEPKQLTPAEIERNKQKMRENMKRMKVNA